MTCVRSTILLVTLGLSCVGLLAGCGTVGQAIIPDYHVNRQILKPLPSEVTITFAPGYPKVCANAKTKDRKWYRTITIYVHLRNQEPAPVSVLINKDGLMESPVATSHEFRYPAGAGRHNIEIWVKSDPIKYFERSLSVYVCGPPLRKIRAYQP